MQNFIDQFEQAFTHSTIGMAVISLDGKYLKVNPAFSRITGYHVEEILSMSYGTFIHPDDLEKGIQQIQTLLEDKSNSIETELRFIQKDGSKGWVLQAMFVVSHEEQPLFFISQVQDITERKQLEQELSESEERFRHLITQIPDPILVHDGTIVLFANPSAAELVNVSLNDMVGQPINKYIGPESIRQAERIIEEITKYNRSVHNFDLTIRTNTGEIKDAILSAIPIIYKGKQAIMVSYRDITERKKVEMALKESEERFRLLIEHSPLGILLHQNRKIQFANATAARLLGANDIDELLGLSIYNIIHPDYHYIASARDEYIDKGKFVPTEYEKFVRLDGKVIDVEVNGIPIQSNGASAIQIVFWDVTEKKKEEDLVRYRAYHDTLTDLPNRLKFHLDVEVELEKAQSFTIMYLDTHGLKPVNDSYGHQAGDTVLIKVTSRMSGVLDAIGRVYRVGGDEFAVILPNRWSEEEIKELIHKIIEVMKQPIYISNSIVQVTASIGIVYSPDHGSDTETLIRHADAAMYYAKKTNTLYKVYEG